MFTDTPLPPDAARSFFQAGITLQHTASALQIATTATPGNMTCKQTIGSSACLLLQGRGFAPCHPRGYAIRHIEGVRLRD
jgi:hypothetical protein